MTSHVLQQQLERSVRALNKNNVREAFEKVEARWDDPYTVRRLKEQALENDPDLIAEIMWGLPGWPDDKDFEEAQWELRDMLEPEEIGKIAEADPEHAKHLIYCEAPLWELVEKMRCAVGEPDEDIPRRVVVDQTGGRL